MKKVIFTSIFIASSYLFAVPTCNDLGLQNFSRSYQVNRQWNSFRTSHGNLSFSQLKQQFKNSICPSYLLQYNSRFFKRKWCSLIPPNSAGPQYTASSAHPAITIIKIKGCTFKIKKIKASIKISNKPIVHGVSEASTLGKPSK